MFTRSREGIRKANVFPVPVLALHTMSVPSRQAGIDCACTLVHTSYFKTCAKALYSSRLFSATASAPQFQQLEIQQDASEVKVAK